MMSDYDNIMVDYMDRFYRKQQYKEPCLIKDIQEKISDKNLTDIFNKTNLKEIIANHGNKVIMSLKKGFCTNNNENIYFANIINELSSDNIYIKEYEALKIIFLFTYSSIHSYFDIKNSEVLSLCFLGGGNKEIEESEATKDIDIYSRYNKGDRNNITGFIKDITNEYFKYEYEFYTNEYEITYKKTLQRISSNYSITNGNILIKKINESYVIEILHIIEEYLSAIIEKI